MCKSRAYSGANRVILQVCGDAGERAGPRPVDDGAGGPAAGLGLAVTRRVTGAHPEDERQMLGLILSALGCRSGGFL